MSARELDAAGITGPALRASYHACRRLHARHGKTYYLATLLLPPAKRPYVHALYGFARYADEIVDDVTSTRSDAERGDWLTRWGEAFRTGRSDDPADRAVLPAIHDTIARWDIPRGHFSAFLASMRMDLTVGEYKTFDELMDYVHGSASVIGLQMLPVLEPVLPDVAEPYAADLGVAFQLSNFIRDVGEDLRRGRMYLPREDLAAFGVEREQLEAGVVDAAVRRLLAFEIARAREFYRAAEPGIRLLHPSSRNCIRTAFRLYAAILDEVERADYRVLDRRVSVGTLRRARVAVPGLIGAARARRDVPARPTRPSSG